MRKEECPAFGYKYIILHKHVEYLVGINEDKIRGAFLTHLSLMR